MAISTATRRSTHRKGELAQLMLQNSSTSRPMTMQEMMLRAGYSESTARARHVEIIGAVRREPEVQSHLMRLQSLRSKILDEMEKKLESANYVSLAASFAILEKSIRLLEGKATARVEYVLSEVEQQELEHILCINE